MKLHANSIGRLGTVWMLIGSVAVAACGDDSAGTDDGNDGGSGGTSAQAGSSSKAGSSSRAGTSSSDDGGEGGVDAGSGGEDGGSGGSKAGSSAGGKGGMGGRGGTGGAAGSSAGGSSGSGGGGAGNVAGSGGGGAGGAAGSAGGGMGGMGGMAGTTNGGMGGVGGMSGAGGTGGGPNCASAAWCKVATAPLKAAKSAVNRSDNSVWVAAKFEEPITLGSSTLTPADGGSWALLHYDANGTLLGAFKTADSMSSVPAITSLAVDSAGGLYVFSGAFSGSLSLPTATTPATLASKTAGPSTDAAVLKFDSNGRYLWGFSFKTSQDGELIDGQIDASGSRVALAFKVGENVDLTQVGVGTTGTGTLIGGGTQDAANVGVLVLDSVTGAFQWAKSYGDAPGQYEQSARCVGLDSNGDVLVAGQFVNTLNFDLGNAGAVLSTSAAEDENGAFVAKLGGASGAHVWSKAFKGGGYTSVTVSSCGLNSAGSDFFMAGAFSAASVSFGGSAITNPNVGDGLSYTYITHLGNAGQHVYSAGVPYTVVSIASDGTGAFSIGSPAAKPVDFGAGALSGTVVGNYSSTGAHQDSQSLSAAANGMVTVAVGNSNVPFAFRSTATTAETEVWRYQP
ncbi:MAG: hypothetical protein K0R38_3822 [Polyangiaceae bacterium]|jgi:hypothetical protein|nr:hypothetical protein [Polyangiaceae bacterium]